MRAGPGDDGRRGGIRRVVEGLRALAVGSVLLYHAGVAFVPGGFVGVDVFFVISGFLITSLMVAEVERDGRLRLRAFWARRARRLLPASTLVLLFSALVTVLWLPATSRRDFGGDVVAAALYVVNWRLGYREVDYLAEGLGRSPVQHYWSLAVEEQFYVVWPLLVALVASLVAARRSRVVLLGTVLTICVASFAWTLSYTEDRPGLAFFVSTTRAWELGTGALVALALPALVRLHPVLRAALGWVGVAAVAVAVVSVDATTAWPGPATLLPVLGTAAALVAGGPGMERRPGVGRLLGSRPAVWVGGLSYSLYLWHWPLLVAAEGIWGSGLTVGDRVLVVVASFLPAWLSYRFVENPVRRADWFAPAEPALRMGLVGTAIACVAGLVLSFSVRWVDTVAEASASEARGAAALSAERSRRTDWTAVDSVDKLRPTPLDADRDRPSVYRTDCVVDIVEDDYQACTFGARHGRRTVVLVGDSKAVQWFTPVEQIARSAGWRLVVIAKSNCEFADVERLTGGGRPNPSCTRWSDWALRRIQQLRPDVVLTVTRWNRSLPPGGSTVDDYTTAAMVDGLVRHWRGVVATGARLVPILDNPSPPGAGVLACVQEHLDHLSACSFPKADRLEASGAPAQLAAAREVPEARVVDMSDQVCPDGETCPPVIGNVLVYRTGTHLSDTYAATTRETLAARIAEATGGLLGG